MRLFFPSAHTLPAPPPHAPPSARGHAVDASHHRQRRQREPNLLSRFSSLLLLPVTAHHTVRAATARPATGERPRRRRRPPSAMSPARTKPPESLLFLASSSRVRDGDYDHRRERHWQRLWPPPWTSLPPVLDYPLPRERKVRDHSEARHHRASHRD